MELPHKSGLLIRPGWIIVLYHALSANQYNSDPFDSGDLGGLTLHDTTYNTPLSYNALLDIVSANLAGRDFTIDGKIVHGRNVVNNVGRVFNRCQPALRLVGNVWVTTFDLYFDSEGGVCAS